MSKFRILYVDYAGDNRFMDVEASDINQAIWEVAFQISDSHVKPVLVETLCIRENGTMFQAHANTDRPNSW